MKKCNWIYLFTVALFTISACGDDISQQDSDSKKTEKSSYDLESKDAQGKTLSIKGNPEGSKESGGASIVGASLELFLVDSNGKTILAAIESKENKTFPGAFEILPNLDGTGTHITWVTTEGVYEGKSGTISLTTCPTAIGEQATGKFNNVVLQSLTGGSDRTINGTFALPVFQKTGDLYCANTDDNNDGPKNNDAGMCAQYEECNETNGQCCEKRSCIRSCEQDCVLNKCLLDPTKCLECHSACLDSCGAPQGCKDANSALNNCAEDANCSNNGLSFSCVKTNCCEELKQAW